MIHHLVSAWQRLVAMVCRRRIAQDVDDEIAFHIAMRRDQLERGGVPPAEAEHRARRQFGNVTRLREDTREMWTFPSLESIVQDVRFAFRTLRRAPGFTIVASLTIALGIGANTAVFTVVDTVLFRAPPFEHVDRLMSVRDVNPEEGFTAHDNVGESPGNFLDWRAQSESFDHWVAWRNWFYSVAGPEGYSAIPEQVRAVRISPTFFTMLGVRAALGRTFRPEEEEPGKERVVLLTDALWQRRYGGDQTIVGRSLLVDGQPFIVVGVLPHDFHFLQPDFEMWLPLPVDENFRGRDEHSVAVYSRLAPGVTRAAAQAELDTITARLAATYPATNKGWGVALVPVHPPNYGGRLERSLLVLLGAVGFVLLIACSNVANLLLVRAGVRQREVAVRTAVGASRARLVRQLLTENGLLALFGTACGLVVAVVGLRLLQPLLPAISTYTHPSLHIDWRVLTFTGVAAVLTTVVFGLLPAIQSSRTGMPRVTAATGRWTAGRALLVAELALSVVLLVGSALLIQTLWNLQRIDPGFRTEELLTMQVWLPERKYPEASDVRSFSDELLRRMDGIVGIRDAATVNTRPFLGWFLGLDVEVPGWSAPDGVPVPFPTYRVVSHGYFDTLGAELLAGRPFATGDGPTGAAVALVNEAAARRYWPDVGPIGRQFRPRFQPGPAPWVSEGRNEWFTVVGLIRDFREHQLDEEVGPVIYLSQQQNPSRLLNVIVRTQGPATSLAGTIQAEIRRMDGDLGVYDLKTMEKILADVVAQPRFNSVLIWVFASLALALSAIGVYGVTSYLVTRRSRELAIRIALVARSGDLFRMITHETILIGGAGVVMGTLGALLLARVLTSVLYGGEPTDPSVLLLASAAVYGVAFAACCRPAWLAMQVDPIRILRAE